MYVLGHILPRLEAILVSPVEEILRNRNFFLGFPDRYKQLTQLGPEIAKIGLLF